MSYSHHRNQDNYNQIKEKNLGKFDKYDINSKFDNSYSNKISKYRDETGDNSINPKYSNKKYAPKENSKNYNKMQYNYEEKRPHYNQKDQYKRRPSYSDADSYSSYSSEDSKQRKYPNIQKRKRRSRSRSQRSSSRKSSSSRSRRKASSSSSSSYKALKRSPKNIQPKLIKKPEQSQLYQNQTHENYQASNIATQNDFQKPEKEMSNTLMVAELGPYINLTVLEEVFNEKCIQLQTSMPEDIRFLESLRAAYIIFPSIPVAAKVYESTGGVIYINGNNYQMEYTPNYTNNIHNQTTSKSITYIRNASDNSPYTTAMETTVHEDWICEFCDCKNFSKRAACFKCKRQKTINCRIIPVIKQKTTVMGEGGQIPPSSSLMARGNILKETNETELLEIFGQLAQVKDIRMISDKISGEPKDFAFIEYYSTDEATMALNQIKRNPIKIRNNLIYVTFSKIRRAEDLKEMNAQYRTTGYAAENHLNQTQILNSGIGTEAYIYSGNNFNQPPQNDPFYFQNANAMNTINPKNLTNEDQNKFANISNLQNQIEKIKNAVPASNLKDTRGETNLRREKELTDREKIELEMRKWTKKIEKQKHTTQDLNSGANNLKAAVLNYEYNMEDNNYDTVVSLDNQIQNQYLNLTNTSQQLNQYNNYNYSQMGDHNQPHNNQNVSNTQFSNEEVIQTISTKIEEGNICHICQRKFPTEEKLKTHENLSTLHKENLKKQAQI